MSVIGIEAYPLYWPEGWKRTDRYRRKRSKFKTSFTSARDGVVKQIKMLGARQPIISTNVTLRRDGLPLAGQRQPEDPGVAVYFTRNGTQQVLACDTYDTVGDNIHAIGLTINALRTIGRHGATTILDRAFKGFTALPAAGRPWHEVLNVEPHKMTNVVEESYRRRLRETHPDAGGSAEAFQEVQRAWEQFKKERGA